MDSVTLSSFRVYTLNPVLIFLMISCCLVPLTIFFYHKAPPHQTIQNSRPLAPIAF